MPETTPNRPRALRALALLVWIALWGLAAFGAFFLGLLIIGMIEFSRLGCGPNRSWGEDIYIACSDIDETNPIFFAIAVPSIAPLLIALLIRFLIRANRASS